jgi:hypothetical protein
MHLGLVMPIIGFALSAVDFIGLADFVERGARYLLDRALELLCWLAGVVKGAFGFVASTLLLLYVILMLVGLIVGLISIVDPTPKESLNAWAIQMRDDEPDEKYVFQVVMTASVVIGPAAAALWALVGFTWAVFFILSKPKKGLVGTLGLLLGAVGVMMELGIGK